MGTKKKMQMKGVIRCQK